MELRKGREDTSFSPGRSSAGMGQLNAFIDQGSEFSGRLSFRDTVRIDGKFEGEISSENTLIVGETGEIQATIQSENVIISGKVEGDVIAPHQVVIHKTARVNGTIRTASLAVEEGAQLNGQIIMDGSAARKGEAHPKETKKANGADKNPSEPEKARTP
jgi:cytoskeletal protein CcmA (bactofilin family)